MISRFLAKSILTLSCINVTLILTGCSVPQYDSQTDQLITSLQTDTDSLLVHLISLDQQIASLSGKTDKTSIAALAVARSSASYASNSSSYNKINVDFLALKTRVDAEPNASTNHLDKALQDISDNLFGSGSLENQHMADNVLSAAYLTPEQKILDAQFSVLLTYELVLKSGSSSSTTN